MYHVNKHIRYNVICAHSSIFVYTSIQSPRIACISLKSALLEFLGLMASTWVYSNVYSILSTHTMQYDLFFLSCCCYHCCYCSSSSTFADLKFIHSAYIKLCQVYLQYCTHTSEINKFKLKYHSNKHKFDRTSKMGLQWMKIILMIQYYFSTTMIKCSILHISYFLVIVESRLF